MMVHSHSVFLMIVLLCCNKLSYELIYKLQRKIEKLKHIILLRYEYQVQLTHDFGLGNRMR